MLQPGTVVGSFEILAPLGAGGMGEVWRARDSKLQREVAIKALPAGLAADPDRLARFQREAQTLAVLNHANIAVIYDLYQDGPTRLLVLELVEGETLAQRILRGPLQVDEAVAIARQIAAALEAAHEKGIVHRDLKPANVKIAPDGVVKVLDFGLAKVAEPSESTAWLSQSPTVLAGTAAGVILGTPGYLSPEQARGKAVDKRTDIWAFGCVLYEMLSGRQTFTGETVSDVMAAILTREVDLQALPPIPDKLRELIARCLQKDPLRRLRDIGDARILLEETTSATTEPPAPAPQGASNRRRPVAWVTALLLAFVAGFVVSRLGQAGDVTPPAWSGTKMGGAEVAWGPRVSPSGSLVAFAAMEDGLTQVAVMQPESGDLRVLTSDRTRGYISCPVSWSPDERIYYGRMNGVPSGVFSVSAVGGEERLVLPDAACPEVLPDGSLLLLRLNEQGRTQLYRHWPGSERVEAYPLLATAEGNGPRAFKDGQEAVLFGKSTDQTDSDQNDHLFVLDLERASVRRVEPDADHPIDAPDDMAFGIGPDDRAILIWVPQGNRQTLLEIPRGGGAARALTSMNSGVNGFDVAPNGDMYVDQTARPLQIFSVDPNRKEWSSILATDAYANLPPAVMPDGRVLFTSEAGGRRRLMAVRAGGNPEPLVQTPEETSGPVTMAGNAEVAFIIGSGRSRQLATASIDGRNVRRLDTPHGPFISAVAATREGTLIYYSAAGSIWAVDREGGKPQRITAGDSVTVDSQGNPIVQLLERATVRLERERKGTSADVLAFPGVSLAGSPFAAGAVRGDGVIVKNISRSDSWLWFPAILHPDTGTVDVIEPPSFLDTHFATWAPDGRLVLYTLQTQGAIWRLRPTTD